LYYAVLRVVLRTALHCTALHCTGERRLMAMRIIGTKQSVQLVRDDDPTAPRY
jgi:hypothetical protein